MTRISSLLAIAAATLPALVAVADSVCLMFLPEWECDVCGGYNPDAPIICLPENATFDDLTAGQPVGSYKAANWINFEVATPGNANNFLPHIKAVSKPNYGLVPAGKKGNMTFNGEFPEGHIYSLHYACARSITRDASEYLAAPVPCTVEVTSNCTQNLAATDYSMSSFSLRYTPTSEPAASMGFALNPDMPSDEQTCSSYAFEAKDLAGQPVDFVLDEVLYMSYQQGFI